MTAPGKHQFKATIERHRPDLPVYLIVPGEIVLGFRKRTTFVAETTVNGRHIGRRSIKAWGDGRWFMELTKAHCGILSLEVGDSVSVAVEPAAEVPADLQAQIAALDLTEAWSRLSEADRRTISEHVFEAKRPATRKARIDRAITRLTGN